MKLLFKLPRKKKKAFKKWLPKIKGITFSPDNTDDMSDKELQMELYRFHRNVINGQYKRGL